MTTPRIGKLFAVLAVTFVPVAAALSEGFARALAPGMSLTYEADGTAQSPWRVDSVQFSAAVGGREDVTRVVQRTRADGPAATRAYVVESGVLLVWDPANNQWRPQRPLTPRREIEVGQANGDTARVVTGDSTTITVGDKKILIIPTTFHTRRAGRPMRRLTEQYAPSLATAVSGVFEVPDSASGAWRVTQRFKLVAIK